MTFDTLLNSDVSARLCLALLHSLWQVPLLVVAVWLLERALRPSVQWRYAIHTAAMIGGFFTLPITFALADVGSLPAAATSAASNQRAQVEPAANLVEAQELRGVGAGPVVGQKDVSAGTQPVASSPRLPRTSVTLWVVALYLVGVLIMLGRLAAGVVWARRLLAGSRIVTDTVLVERFEALLRQCQVRVNPVLASAAQVVVPKIVGLLRPTILLPASALTGLSIGDLELILTHELSHLRRYDMWVNLLQRVAEALLFYNPALWFLSRRISTLREYCCDELTCRLAAQNEPEPRIRYATTLLKVAEFSAPRLGRSASDVRELATLAAGGRSPSEIRRRVACLLGEPIQEPIRLSPGNLLAIVAFFAVLVVGPMAWRPRAAAFQETSASSRAGTAAGASGESADAANSETAAEADGLTATLPDGVTVTLLGVANHRDRHAGQVLEWWEPDGSARPQQPYSRPHTFSNEPVAYEFAFEVSSTDDFGFTGGMLFYTGRVSDEGKDLPQMRVAISRAISADARAADISVGLACGEWQDVEAWRGYRWKDGSATIANGKSVVIRCPTEQAGAVEVTLVHTYVDFDTRLVAVNDGKMTAGERRPFGSGDGIAGTVFRFPNVTLDSLGDVLFQKRPYTWMTFHDVSVSPGHSTAPRVTLGNTEGHDPLGATQPDARDAGVTVPVYQLSDDQILKWIPPEQTGQRPQNPQPQSSGQIYEQEGAKVRLRIQNFGGEPFPLHAIVDHLLHVRPCELTGDASAWIRDIRGDFVVRRDSAPERLLESLNQALQRKMELNVSLRWVERESEAWIVTGNFRPAPIGEPWRIPKEDYKAYALYGQTGPGAGVHLSSGAGSFDDLLKAFAYRTGRPVINELKDSPPGWFGWETYYDDPEHTTWNDFPRNFANNVELVTGHFREQTGLQFRTERRMVRLLEAAPEIARR